MNRYRACGIFDDYILIVDRFLTARNMDLIVAANLNGEFVCKMLDIPNRSLLSANPAHRPVTIDDCDVFTIKGVVSRSNRCHRASSLLEI